jgi:hypothetical protein
MLFFLWIPAEAHASSFIGLKVAHSLCHAQISLTGSDAESNIGHIWLSRNWMSKFNHSVQRFIIKHECGHAHGISSELGADLYAINHTHMTRKLANQVCYTLSSFGDVNYKSRCAQLRKLSR